MIAAPGIYDLPMSIYHAQCTDGPSVSSSDLRRFLDCPARAFAHWSGNHAAVPEGDSSAKDFGRAAHALVLEDGTFERYFAVSPYDALTTKEARAWRDAQEEKGLQVLKARDLNTIQAMVDAVRAHPFAEGFRRGRSEQSLFLRDETTGLWLKSRPDKLPTSGLDWIKDYKSCASASPEQFSAAAFRFGYHIQAALQVDLASALTGLKIQGAGFIVQEKKPPYLVEAYYLMPDQIALGRRQYRAALEGFARCLAEKHWPSYTDEPRPLTWPRWLKSEGEAYVDHGDSNGASSREWSAGDYLAAG